MPPPHELAGELKNIAHAARNVAAWIKITNGIKNNDNTAIDVRAYNRCKVAVGAINENKALFEDLPTTSSPATWIKHVHEVFIAEGVTSEKK